MKPDGVATAALEPMETLESSPVNETAPVVGEEPNQAASQVEEAQKPTEEMGQGEVQVDPAKETLAAKTSSKASADPKAKSTNKAAAKTKPGATSPTKTTPGSRPNTSQNRLINGMSKPQTNGVAKKTTAVPDKKSTPTSASTKKPTGTAGALASKSAAKVGEKKATGAANGVKSTTGTTATKKTSTTAANSVKTSTTAVAAKKPTAPKPASAALTKSSSAASPKLDRPPVSKTTRPPTGTAAPRPATASTRPPTASTTKSTTNTAKSAPSKSSTTPKPAASKPTSTTPSGGKPPASQTSRTTTPVKKDVTKSSTPAAKKSAESPLTRPSSVNKSAKPDTPKTASKSDSTPKKPAPTKTPTRPKTEESKPTASKTPGSKPAATKASSPKKTVGSSTPTPVKRGPKAATLAEPASKANEEKEVAAVATTVAIATAAAVIARSEEAEPSAEAESAVEPAVDVAELMSNQNKPTFESMQETTPEPIPEPLSASVSESVQEITPKSVQEPVPEPVREPTPEPIREKSPEPLLEPEVEDVSIPQLSAQQDLAHLEDSTNNLVPSLGTTVMSPPCSPPGHISPVREPQNASSLLDMHVQSDLWDKNQHLAFSDIAAHSPVDMMGFQRDSKEEEEEKENLFMPTSTAPSGDAFNMMDQPHLLGTSPMGDFTSKDLISPQEKEEAMEKADEEINEDDDEDEEDEEQRRLGHQPSSIATDMSTSQPSEEFQIRSSAFGGSAGWHGDDLLSGLDSEDMSSCTSSRQQGISDMSSAQHTAILEGTQSSDALIDSSLRGSEGDGNLMGSPNVETLANEEEEDEDEEDERVDEMDLSSERIEEHHKAFQEQEQDEEEEDDDVEMPSEGVTESCGNVDDDDLNEEERLDNLNRPAPVANVPPSWGQNNPFSDSWAQPASLLSVSSPSPLSDHGAAESETPTQSPAHAYLDSGAPSLAPQSEQESQQHESSHGGTKCPAPEETHVPPAGPAVGMSQSSTLSGTALAVHSSSETSTPEELRDYDSSSGVESHSDKQQTPVPASVQPDMEQDLGIHLEKGDGEEEEAETLPADEVLGTGPPTAPASAPSSPSTSGDEASDTEGEMQINDPDTPMTTDETAGFESPPPTCNLAALDEDEEAADAPAGEGDEDGGGATPQSANSVASYGFDCTTSNSNAHSMAESCGKSPGIFSLENEEQLSEEAKDPSLIKELTLPSAAAAQAEDLLGKPVDLMPLGHPGENQGLDDHHYMLGGKIAADNLEEVDPLESSHHLQAQHPGDSSDSQPSYYSTLSDKTDSFLAGNV
ncbi:hypothetical protein LDENG_00067870 [Lucifuga dentata]|nr:hypothetical protein LDENG_00067870 [Lucifuga dentata]